MGQTFTTLGSSDPCLTASGKLDLCISPQLAAYKKEDLPPSCVIPIPFPIIAQTANLCCTANKPIAHTIADIMLLLGFFFLLWPGEYAYTAYPDASPFRFCDVHILVHNCQLNLLHCTPDDFDNVNFIDLEFTSQKNGMRGELIAPPMTTLYSYYDRGWQRIDTMTLTTHLHGITAMGAQYGIEAHQVSIRSLCSFSTMSLLCERIDTDCWWPRWQHKCSTMANSHSYQTIHLGNLGKATGPMQH